MRHGNPVVTIDPRVETTAIEHDQGPCRKTVGGRVLKAREDDEKVAGQRNSADPIRVPGLGGKSTKGPTSRIECHRRKTIVFSVYNNAVREDENNRTHRRTSAVYTLFSKTLY